MIKTKRILDLLVSIGCVWVGYALLSISGALPFVGHVIVNGQDYSNWGALCFGLVGAMMFRDGGLYIADLVLGAIKKSDSTI